MDSLISVIVPVYNVENFLPRCVESICNQTYYNIEIILVDDGSTDSSGKICEEYASKDRRITVIHQTNQGVSSARNAGLSCKMGEYFLFVDGDDELLSNAIELVMATFEREDVEAVFYRLQKKWKDSGKIEEIPMQTGVFENSIVIPGILTNYADYGAGWPVNKVWYWPKKKGKIPEFDRNLYYFEDLEWVIRMLLQTKKICLIPQCGYIYHIRENSVSCQTGMQERREYGYHCSILKVLEALETIPNVKKWFTQKYRYELVNGVIHAKMHGWNELARFLSDKVYTQKREILVDSKISLTIKIRCICIVIAKWFQLL